MFSDPVKNIEKCNIQVGQDIADLGSGSGFYSIAAAKALSGTGRVHAVDAQKDLLTKLKNEAVRQGLPNIEVIWGNIENIGGTKLREGSINLALLCNVLFQLEDKRDIALEVKRILKPAGRVLVVDWEGAFGGVGPKADMVVKKETVKSMFEKAGFHLDKNFAAGAHHYGLIFKKL